MKLSKKLFGSMIENREQILKLFKEIENSQKKLGLISNESIDLHIEKIQIQESEKILSEVVSRPKERKEGLLSKISDITEHGPFSIPLLIATMLALALFFIYTGAFLEEKLFFLGTTYISPAINFIVPTLIPIKFGETLAFSLSHGLVAFLAIVIPYVLLFFILLAIVEDTGYLARIAVLLDGFMSKIGLYGKSIVPFIVGCGCNVTGVLGSRIIEAKRERVLTVAILCTAIPCCGRIVVISGFVNHFAGPLWVLGTFAVSALMAIVLAIIGSRLLPGERIGLVIEIPPFRLPRIKSILLKTYINLKEFVTIALPVLLIAATTLAILSSYGVLDVLVNALSPLMIGWLGLPAITVVPLLYALFRREEGAAMFPVAAGGLAAIESILQPHQVFFFALLTAVPCITTVVALKKEFGLKICCMIYLLTIFIWYSIVGMINQIMLLMHLI